MSILNRKKEAPPIVAEVAAKLEAFRQPERALIGQLKEARNGKQEEYMRAAQIVAHLGVELDKLRREIAWLEDHPEFDEIHARLLALEVRDGSK